MSRILGPGPYKTLTTHDGIDVPFYIVRFDKKGLLQSPETAKEIISRAHEFSDVFFFSHGWNNDWTCANKRYQDFFDEYSKLRQAHDLAMPAGYKPMMVGVFWPSTALVFGKSERGPDFMDMDPPEADDDYPEDRFLQDLAEVADILEEEDRSALYSLAQTNGLSRQQALQLAELMTKVVSDSEGEIDHVETVAPQALLDSWIEASESGAGSPGHGGAQIKDTRIQDGFFKVLDPRRIIRLLTVAIMKDRAGVVGHAGVGGVLQQLLDNSAARIHLVGHSYGAKVMLSARCPCPGSFSKPLRRARRLWPTPFGRTADSHQGGARSVCSGRKQQDLRAEWLRRQENRRSWRHHQSIHELGAAFARPVRHAAVLTDSSPGGDGRYSFRED